VRKRNKLRDVRRLLAEEEYDALLEQHSRRYNQPLVITCDDLSPIHRAKIEAYRAFALRPPKDWHHRIKSRSAERRLIDLVRFAFARYRVPAHLEDFWLRDIDDDFVDDPRPRRERRGARPPGPPRPDLIRWYIIIAQGGSLYRQAAHPYLSKAETHHFLNAPTRLASGQRTLWYAVARACTEETIVAARVSRTKLTDFSIASTYWKEVARFFARNPMSIDEMNDLIDYLSEAKQMNDAFTLKGRTLATLRSGMEDWHRALAKAQALGGGSWPGRLLADVAYEVETKAEKAVWRFRQITTGDDLLRESRDMHHCVASYKARCVNGDVSIWSLTCEHPIGQVNKGITIEVRRDGSIVQCRGFGNRAAYGNEMAMVRRWADEFGLKCREDISATSMHRGTTLMPSSFGSKLEQ